MSKFLEKVKNYILIQVRELLFLEYVVFTVGLGAGILLYKYLADISQWILIGLFFLVIILNEIIPDTIKKVNNE